MEKIIIPPHTTLKLIKCNVLVAELVNALCEEDYIAVTKEEIGGHNLYTYATITDESMELVITFDSYTFLEIKE